MEDSDNYCGFDYRGAGYQECGLRMRVKERGFIRKRQLLQLKKYDIIIARKEGAYEAKRFYIG